MTRLLLIFSFSAFQLFSFSGHALTNAINNGRLQGPLDANYQDILRVRSITDTNGNPLIGGTSDPNAITNNQSGATLLRLTVTNTLSRLWDDLNPGVTNNFIYSQFFITNTPPATEDNVAVSGSYFYTNAMHGIAASTRPGFINIKSAVTNAFFLDDGGIVFQRGNWATPHYGVTLAAALADYDASNYITNYSGFPVEGAGDGLTLAGQPLTDYITGHGDISTASSNNMVAAWTAADASTLASAKTAIATTNTATLAQLHTDMGATNAAGTNSSFASQIAGDAAVSTNLFVTNGAILKGRFYPTLEAANAVSSPGDTIRLMGNSYVSNKVVLTNVHLDMRGAILRNYFTNSPGGLACAINPYAGSVIEGGTISNMMVGIYQGAIGFDHRGGDVCPTNFTIKDIDIYGDTDGLFFVSSNACSGLVKNVRVFSKWDALVAAHWGNIEYQNCKFQTDGTSTRAGATARIGLAFSGMNRFNNCQFSASGNVDSSMFGISYQSGIFNEGVSTNDFTSCAFEAYPTNTTAIVMYSSSQTATTNLARFYRPTFIGTAANLVGISITQTKLELYDPVILQGVTNNQVVAAGGNATLGTVFINGSGNLDNSRMSGFYTVGGVSRYNWTSSLGQTNSYASAVAASNVYSLNFTGNGGGITNLNAGSLVGTLTNPVNVTASSGIGINSTNGAANNLRGLTNLGDLTVSGNINLPNSGIIDSGIFWKRGGNINLVIGPTSVSVSGGIGIGHGGNSAPSPTVYLSERASGIATLGTTDGGTNGTLVASNLFALGPITANGGFSFPTNTISTIVGWTNGVAGTWNSNGTVFLVTSKRGATNQAFTLLANEAP